MEPASLRTLLTAWEAWDKRPGDERAATNMVAACSLYAAKLDLTYSEFRNKLNYHRRRGLSLRQVAELVERTVDGKFDGEKPPQQDAEASQ